MILNHLGQEAEVSALVSIFLKVTAMGLPAFAFNEVMKYNYILRPITLV